MQTRVLTQFLLLNFALLITSSHAKEAPPFRFAVIGDFGQAGPAEDAVAAMVKSWNVEWVVTVGDNSYPVADAKSLKTNLLPYLSWIDKDPSKNRFWPAVGNHDYIPGFGFRFFLDYFKALNRKVVYTVKKGPVQFFMLDSHPRIAEGKMPYATYLTWQKEWLKQEIDKSKASWKIVLFHHPPFSSSGHGSSDWMQWDFKGLGVDLVLTGHEHVYQRREELAYPLFINGMGGRTEFYGCCEQKNVPGKVMCFTNQNGAQLGVATADKLTLTMKGEQWPGRALDDCTLTKKNGKVQMTCQTLKQPPLGLAYETCEAGM